MDPDSVNADGLQFRAGSRSEINSRTVADHIAVYHVAQAVESSTPSGFLVQTPLMNQVMNPTQTEGRQPVRVGCTTKKRWKNDTDAGVRRVTINHVDASPAKVVEQKPRT